MVINDDPLKSSPSKGSRKDLKRKKALATKGKVLIFSECNWINVIPFIDLFRQISLIYNYDNPAFLI